MIQKILFKSPAAFLNKLSHQALFGIFEKSAFSEEDGLIKAIKQHLPQEKENVMTWEDQLQSELLIQEVTGLSFKKLLELKKEILH